MSRSGDVLYLIDLGSSTVKVYRRINEKNELVRKKSLWLKQGFDRNKGISEEKQKELFDFFSEIIDEYCLNNTNAKIYATGVFRKIVNKQEMIDSFFSKTGLFLNIISHDLEAFYLENIWKNVKSKMSQDMIVINIGNDTTEIIACKNEMKETYKLAFGVSNISEKYPLDTELVKEVSYADVLEAIKEDIVKILGDVTHSYKYALYTGGELTYMNVAQYPLVNNLLFEDASHPSIISIDDYYSKNHDVFHKICLSKLEELMPDNPKWMHGARACSVLANAICLYFGVKEIIPSDTNLIDGVSIQEVRNVAICGSFNSALKEISDLSAEFNNMGIEVLSPKCTEISGREGDFVIFKDDIIENHNTWAIERLHLDAIDNCDCVIACNYNSHIGISTTFELKYAYDHGKRIIFTEDNDEARTFGNRWGMVSFPSEIGVF